MKTAFILLFLVFCCIFGFAQEERFQIQGRILDANEDPIGDVYIVNPRNNEKDISQTNGVFTVTVLPGDSLILSHISYLRKSVTVQAILMNPIIFMESENVDIKEITVSPDQMNDYDRAMNNLTFLNEYKASGFSKIKEESSPTNSIMTGNNRLMKNEASSVSLLRFSPSENLSKALKKQKNTLYDYSSTKKQMETETKKEEEDELEVQ